MRAAAAALAVLMLAGQARAADGVTTYPASFFAEAQPYSTLDMIRRLPGFSLDAGDDEVRGLSGGAGNVLIDGERPATKEDLEALLARLPADAVERIELIRGAVAGVDMQGHQLVANVVRRRTAAAVTGQLEAAAFAHRGGRVAPQVRLQGAERRGERLLEGSFRIYRELDDEGGAGRRRRFGADGELVRDAAYEEDARTDLASVKTAYERPAAGGRLALQLGLDRERSVVDVVERRVLPDAGLSLQDERETLSALEAGLSFERGELSIIGLQRLRRTTEREVVSGDDDERFESRTTAGESVAAVTLNRPIVERLQVRLGAEAAFNFLDGRAALEEDGEPVALPSADVLVRETRGELSAAATWRPAVIWMVEAGARLEASRLSHGGEADVDKTLVYLKPRAFLSRDLAGGRELRLRVEREVGQLDFEDFAASASLLSDVVTAGNADLEPETAWVFEAALEQRLFGAGAVVISYRLSRIDNVLDRIPVAGPDEVFDAPGNIGRGRRRELGLTVTLPLGRFGVPGGLLTGEAAWGSSSVTDPTTGERRRISGDEPLEGEIHFSQDLPAWRFRWGVDLVLAEEEWEHRFDQVERVGAGTWVAAFAEYAPAPDWRVRLDAGNLTDRRVRRRRELYDGPRGASPPDARDVRALRFGPFVGLTVRRSL